MTTLTPRDALEVLGRALGNIGDEGYNVTHASLALTVLTTLVERAGEPVAWQDHEGYVWADKVAADEYFEGRPYTLIPCYAIPTVAPGASHER